MVYRRLIGLVALIAAGSVFAGELEQKTELLCERMAQCTWKNLDVDHMSADMEQTITSSLDGLCLSVKKSVDPLRAQNAQNQAKLCIDSMLALDCDALIYNEVQTPACSTLKTRLSAP